MREKKRGAVSFYQGIALLFLGGFLLGGIFYFLFQNSFTGLFDGFMKGLQEVVDKEQSAGYKMVQALWKHGRFFVLFWLLSVTVLHDLYRCFFVAATGFRNGFFLFFLLKGKGSSGILLYFAEMFPQVLLFVPLYLFSFLWAKEKGHNRKHKRIVYVLIGMAFFAACYIEAVYNVGFIRRSI